MGSSSRNIAQTEQKEENERHLARKHGNRTRRKVMDLLLKEEYKRNITKEIGVAKATVDYHLDELRDDELAEKTGVINKRTYYRLTPKGEEVLEHLNVPEY